MWLYAQLTGGNPHCHYDRSILPPSGNSWVSSLVTLKQSEMNCFAFGGQKLWFAFNSWAVKSDWFSNCVNTPKGLCTSPSHRSLLWKGAGVTTPMLIFFNASGVDISFLLAARMRCLTFCLTELYLILLISERETRFIPFFSLSL